LYTPKSNKVDKKNLKDGDVVWSQYFQAYVEYIGNDLDDDYCFKYLHKDGYCIIYTSDIYEPEGILKELL
jgi:hypothetical protein